MNNSFNYNLNENELLILLYHGVYEHKLNGIENYSGKHLKKNEFISQLQLLKKNNFTFLSFDEIIYIITSKKKFPKNSVAISFDDGFKNNYKIACPILDDLKIPAIFYVCSGMIGKNDIFWIDKIEACINNTEIETIKLNLHEKVTFQIKDRQSKINANEVIKKYCKRSRINIRDIILNELQRKSNVETNPDLSLNYKIILGII